MEVEEVLVIQSDAFNDSRLATVIVLSLTSNLELQTMPGCVMLRSAETNLPKDSVANATQIRTLDRSRLQEQVGQLDDGAMFMIDNLLRVVLNL